MTEALVWPASVHLIDLADVVRGRASEFRHRGIVLHHAGSATAALLDLKRDPGAIVVVPSNLRELPLLQFIDLAVELTKSPVLVALAPGTGAADVRAWLDRGAAGLVTPPVTPQTLGAALSGIARAAPPAPEVISHGPLTLDTGRHRVTYSGVEVSLGRKEFDVLAHLMRAHPNVTTIADLVHCFADGEPEGHSRIRMTITRLRHRFGTAPVIETVYGVGYRLATATDA